MLIGLTGENCSGKGTTAEYLMKKGFHYLSLSDVIREELKAQGKEPTRDVMIEHGNELRKKFGPGVLALKTIENLDGDKNYIIDSIRLPAEVKEMKKQHGFYLIYVTAPQEIRFERMSCRGRVGDPKTFEEFMKLEKIEEENADKSKQNLKETSKLADKILVNNGNMHSLMMALIRYFQRFRLTSSSCDHLGMNIS
jgi:dephospho-CoA kinase